MPAAAPTQPADGAAALATQAGARLQQMLQQMLAQSGIASDQTALLTHRIHEQQAASVSSIAAASYRIFDIIDQHRRIALRDVPKLNDLDPLDPKPLSFADAVGQVNAWLRDPLLEKKPGPKATERALLADFKVAAELPLFPETSEPLPPHAAASD